MKLASQSAPDAQLAWLGNRDLPGDKTAKRVAHQRDAIDSERIQKGVDITRQIRNRIAGLGAIRIAESALIDGH